MNNAFHNGALQLIKLELTDRPRRHRDMNLSLGQINRQLSTGITTKIMQPHSFGAWTSQKWLVSLCAPLPFEFHSPCSFHYSFLPSFVISHVLHKSVFNSYSLLMLIYDCPGDAVFFLRPDCDFPFTSNLGHAKWPRNGINEFFFRFGPFHSQKSLFCNFFPWHRFYFQVAFLVCCLNDSYYHLFGYDTKMLFMCIGEEFIR